MIEPVVPTIFEFDDNKETKFKLNNDSTEYMSDLSSDSSSDSERL